jgi:Na+/H+ antiporter NhaD/arsenite permease-like protein
MLSIFVRRTNIPGQPNPWESPHITFNGIVGACSALSGAILIVVGIIYVLYFRSKKRAVRRRTKLNEKLAKIREARHKAQREMTYMMSAAQHMLFFLLFLTEHDTSGRQQRQGVAHQQLLL